MIESLRAEIGLAKAEEYKAKDGLTKLTATVERLQGDYERARKVKEKADHESRKREGEVSCTWGVTDDSSTLDSLTCRHNTRPL